MSTAGSASSSQAPVQDQPKTKSRYESINETKGIEIEYDDDEVELVKEKDGAEAGLKRQLTSVVSKEFKRVRWNGKIKAKCNYCSTKLSGETKSGTKHLHDHLKSYTQRKIKLAGNKQLSHTSLSFNCTDAGKIYVENYTFDQDVARKKLGAMMVMHEYPLSMIDHVGF